MANVIDEFELRTLSVSSSLLKDAVRIVLVVFLASMAAAVLSRLMRRIKQKMTSKRSDPDSVGRVTTAYRTGLIFGRIVIWSVAGVTLLSIMGVSIAPLLTAAGVAGIAAGFAAQGRVKDYFSGFIILLEGQLRVDDIVEIGGHIGVVEEITLRSVRLRDYDGNVPFVPCGNITNVLNMTMEYSRPVIDEGIAYREKSDEALGIMHNVASQMAQNRAFADRIIDEPVIVGVEALGESAVIMRLRLKVTPGRNGKCAGSSSAGSSRHSTRLASKYHSSTLPCIQGSRRMALPLR